MNFKKIFYTLVHLRPIQVFGRIAFELNKPVPNTNSLYLREIRVSGFPALKKTSITATSNYIFLNEQHELEGPGMWNCDSLSKLWLYNLHYFDDLNAPGHESKKELHQNLIARWIEENPPVKGVGWDPYPISLRMVNWIKWYFNGNQLSSKALKSLAIQARYLNKRLEYHLLANHLFANAKALLFAGMFFEGKEAEKWIKKGLSILNREIPEQILSDGGNFERSPMYHSIMIEDILDMICIAQNYQHPLLSSQKITEWKETVRKMLHWLNAMCHGDTHISLFNDAAMGISPEYYQLSNYAEKLGIKADQEKLSDLIDLTDTGYISFNNDNYKLIIDAGNIGPDYQPGHAHADTLSFELSKCQNRIIVDSGTSCYGTGAERLRQRGTHAHNTVSVDGFDSSEIWGGFRVARRAKVRERKIERSDNSIIVVAAHDGFRRISGVGNHIRKWIIDNSRVTIVDTIEGLGKHHIEANLHFHPDIEIHINNNIATALYSGKICGKLFFDSAMKIEIENSTYHPQFGLSLKNKKVIIINDVELPFTFKTVIEV